MRETRNYCSLCSLACPLIMRGGGRSPIFGTESMLSLDWDSSPDSKYGGSLCARGSAMVEYVSHAKRLNYPFILGERSTLAAAVKDAAKHLEEIKKEHGADSIGVLLGENLTNEEAALAMRFARDVLGTSNIELFAPDDIPLFRAHHACDLSGLKAAGAKPSGDGEVVLVIGDLFAEHPCTAKDVLPMRNASRSSGMIVVSPGENNTSWFATKHLRCKPGGETAVAAGLLKAAAGGENLPADLAKFVEGTGWNEIERFGGVTKDEIEDAAKFLLGAAKVRTYISNIFGRIAGLEAASLFVEALTRICPGDSEFIPQFVQQNTWGIYSTLAKSGTGGLLGKLESPELKALVILGLDIFSAFPAGPVEKALREKKFTVTTQVFWNQTASRANVVIPSSILVEKKGTVSPAFGEDLERDGSLDPPGGAVSDSEFITALAHEMGSDLSAGGADRIETRSGSGEWLGESWNQYASEMGTLDTAETVLIPWSESVHAADGSVSRNLLWSDVTSPDPVLYLSKEFAGELGLSDGDTMSVTSEGGEAVLAVKITGRLKEKIVGATIHFPAVRKLFPWKLDERSGEIRLAPVGVRLGRQSEKS